MLQYVTNLVYVTAHVHFPLGFHCVIPSQLTPYLHGFSIPIYSLTLIVGCNVNKYSDRGKRLLVWIYGYEGISWLYKSFIPLSVISMSTVKEGVAYVVVYIFSKYHMLGFNVIGPSYTLVFLI